MMIPALETCIANILYFWSVFLWKPITLLCDWENLILTTSCFPAGTFLGEHFCWLLPRGGGVTLE